MGLHIQLALAGVSLALAAGFITNTQDFKKNQLHRESRSNNPDAPDFSSYYPEQTFELEEYMAMKAGKVGKPFSIPPQGLGYNTPSTQINAPQANSEQYFGKQLQTSPLQYDPHGSLVKGNPNQHIPSPHPSKPTNSPLQPALSSDDDFFKGFGESGMFQDDGEWGSDTWGADANSDWMVDPSLAAAQQPTQAAAHPTQAAAHSNPAGSSFKSGQSQGLMPGQNYNPRDFRALMQNPYKPMSHSQFNALNFPIQTMTLDEPAAIPVPAAIAREEVITKEGKQGYPGFTKMEGFLPEHAMHVIENSISGINSNTIEMPSMMDEEKTPKHTPHVYSHEHAHAHKSDHSHGHKHGHEHKAEHKHGHKHEHQVSSSHKHDHKHSSKHGHDHKHGHTHLAEHKHGHNHTSSHGHDHKHEHKAGHKHLHQHKQDHTHGHTHKGEHKHHHVHEHHHHHHHKHSHASEHKHGHDHKHDHKGIY